MSSCERTRSHGGEAPLSAIVRAPDVQNGAPRWRPLAALSFGIVTLAAVASCAEQRVSGVPPSQSTAIVPPVARAEPQPSAAVTTVAASSASAPAASGSTAWVDAVRYERWADAAKQLDELSEAERNEPEIRFVRARAAIALGDHARAVELLTGLEARLPALARDIVRWRAEAAVEAGPHADAAAYFGKSTKARDLLRAATALDKGGDRAAARRMADKAVAAAQKSKQPREEAAARSLRARLAADTHKAEALGDLKWIAVRAAGSAEGRAAAQALAEMAGVMTPKERFEAVVSMIERGAASEALTALDDLKPAPGVTNADLLHARAMALYKSRRWAEAARAFREAAAGKSGREAEQLFYAARALARDGKDDEAIKLFREVHARFRKGPFAERASREAARLMLQNGRFAQAAQAYTSHLGAHARGETRDEAEYERALALLSSDSPKKARRAFADLAKDAKADQAPRLRELEGVAALRSGDRQAAIAIWTEIAKKQPLTWAAQLSRARLAAVGAPLPPLVEPPRQRTAAPLDVRLPPVPALLARLGLDADAEAALTASEQEAAARYAGRESEALCAMYGMLSRAKRRYRVGSAAVSFDALMRAPSQADRWTWECVYPEPYEDEVRKLERRFDLPRGLVHALMKQESAFDPAALSPVNAVGLMQLMPATAERAAREIALELGPGDVSRPDVNLTLGAYYIGKLLQMFEGNVVLAVAAYNAGPKAVSHWLASGKDMDTDLVVARIPYEETRSYVARVMTNFARYQWLFGGDAAVSPVSLELPVGARAPEDAY